MKKNIAIDEKYEKKVANLFLINNNINSNSNNKPRLFKFISFSLFIR